MSLLRPPLTALVDLVYPPHCAGCGVRQPVGQWLCATCESRVRRLHGPKCPICSRPFGGALEAFLCPNCRNEALHLDFALSVMRSDGLVRELIHRFKYGREFHLRRVLGDWLAEAFSDQRLAATADVCLAPVPLHPARLRERRFNQSEALACWIGRRLGLRVERPLRRRRHTVTQTHFDRRQRMRNLRGAFALRHNADVNDKSFLLVDDVLTTGSTLDECARVLLEGGACSVRAITVARG
ncbi:MAG: ComF family protein [Terrimicrobiaceae bacterium]|nr:ComF family protein [Terrimicrobiaceae bacterium]